MELYAQIDTVEVTTRRFPGFPGQLYAVRWVDQDGHHRATRMVLHQGDANLLAATLRQGEPYIRDEWVH